MNRHHASTIAVCVRKPGISLISGLNGRKSWHGYKLNNSCDLWKQTILAQTKVLNSVSLQRDHASPNAEQPLTNSRYQD